MTQLAEIDKSANSESDADAFDWPPKNLIAEDFAAWLLAILAEPGKFAGFLRDINGLLMQALLGLSAQEEEKEEPKRRYRHPAWRTILPLRLAKNVHSIIFDGANQLLDRTAGLSAQRQRRLRFWLKHLGAATHPANNLWMNPEVRDAAAATNGNSIKAGIELLKADLAKSRRRLRIGRQPENAFELGRDIATTPSRLIAENKLVRLLHYAPQLKTAKRASLLIVPPCINRYYVLDLRPNNSFVAWCVAQGVDVYMIDWRPALPGSRNWRFEDYVVEGVDWAWRQVTGPGDETIDVLGYCIGGTLAVCHAAWRAAQGSVLPRSLSLLTTMLDFSEPGELGVFVSDDQLDRLDRHLDRHGLLTGELLRSCFELLQPDELMWTMALRRYGLGKENKPQDLLFWSDDNPALPGRMIQDYLRQCYLQNRLIAPGGMKIAGVPLHLREISAPIFAVATDQDHIAPWTSVFHGLSYLPKVRQFVLAGGGHIGGIVSPPSHPRASHRIGPMTTTPERWRASSIEDSESWWPTWHHWIRSQSRERE